MLNSTAAQLQAHILLVEDDMVNQIVIKGLLGLLGCSVEVIGNGQEALTLLTGDNHYDLVLMDIGLPDINGMEVTKQLRQSNSKLQQVPVVALTGHIQVKDQQECFSSGMNAFIPKPTTKEILSQELGKILQK